MGKSQAERLEEGCSKQASDDAASNRVVAVETEKKTDGLEIY